MNKEKQLLSIIELSDGRTQVKMEGSPADISIAIASMISQSSIFKAIIATAITVSEDDALVSNVTVIKKEEGFIEKIRTQGDA